MTEQLVTKVNDAQVRWKQVDTEMLNSKTVYLKHLEVSYEMLREFSQRESELLVALLHVINTPVDKLAADPAVDPTTTVPVAPRLDNVV